ALSPAVAIIRLLGLASENRKFRQRRRYVVWIDTGRRGDKKMLDGAPRQHMQKVICDAFIVLKDSQMIASRIINAECTAGEMKDHIRARQRALHGFEVFEIALANLDAINHSRKVFVPTFREIISDNNPRANGKQTLNEK